MTDSVPSDLADPNADGPRARALPDAPRLAELVLFNGEDDLVCVDELCLPTGTSE